MKNLSHKENTLLARQYFKPENWRNSILQVAIFDHSLEWLMSPNLLKQAIKLWANNQTDLTKSNRCLWRLNPKASCFLYTLPLPHRGGVGGGGRQQQTYHFLCKWNRDKIIPRKNVLQNWNWDTLSGQKNCMTIIVIINHYFCHHFNLAKYFATDHEWVSKLTF